ncbi:hypothetical protein FEM48_Zijuj04G0092900 [Ziziphus jujuba var. spinosa]|uniref:At1g61320/AtMIF1 LRR domain-containing protein n=1 Tax=Ziziphus jujuba var. spinosa TaxID=714518 RepID=A0A978VJ08_ZIZJJ|nr:hypothetical protein FEM48_Zijuj04G0092100 [Ziziphus jujuba var. spinosa]KAH7533085.1 hypothetical protein FEM48_Zijuj04G0092900 [Ziziphus jujuba var. spinosa]
MSFLSVEKAARLRVVCRRWNELWETMIGFTPRLKFTRRKALKIWKTNSLEYVKGVDKAMKLNTNASQTDLEELTIEVPLDKFFSDDVNRWVEFGVKRRVKKLKLDFSYNDCLCYPATFLANLSMFWLKDLSMKSLDVGDKDIECIFTNSPNLERLCVDNSDILEKFEVACAPNLKYLTISFCENLKHLHISNPNHNIMISCGEYCWPKKVKLSSSNMSQLNPTFCFNHSFFNYNNTLELIQPNPFICFDEGFPNFDPYRELFGQLKRLRFKIPREVEHLEVELLPSKNGPLPSGWDLLQAAPVVHDLSIQWVDKDAPMKAKANTKYWGSHQDLEVVTLVGFSGCKKELELVLNLVKIAASLKKIIIQLLPSEYWRDLSLEQVNQYSKICQYSAQLLKTQIPSHILVVII